MTFKTQEEKSEAIIAEKAKLEEMKLAEVKTEE